MNKEAPGIDREVMYRAVIETMADGFWLSDREGRILEVNDAYVKRSGYSREELLAMRIVDLEAPESTTETAEHIEKIIREGNDIFETLHRTRDGTVWAVEVNVSYRQINGGRFFNFLRDTSSRKRSEALLQIRLELSELSDQGSIDDLLQRALDAAELHTGSTIGFFHFVDEDQVNLTLQTWSTNTLRNMCTAEGKGRHYPILQAGVWVDCFSQRGPVIHNDYAGLTHRKGMPEGHAKVVRELVVPILRGDKIVSIIGVGNKTFDYDQEDVQAVQLISSLVMDLVFRKRAEAELRESQARLTRAQLVARLGNWGWDFRANKMHWSDENYRIFGIAPNVEPSYEAFIQTVAPEERERVNQAVSDSLAGKKRFDIDYSIIRTDSGERRIINAKADVLRDSKGSVVKMVGTVQDITKRKKVEDALRQSVALYHDLVETAQDLIWQCDAEGRYTYLNPAWETVLGYRLDEMLGKKFTDFQSSELAARDSETFSRLLECGVVRGYETIHLSRDGRDIHLVFNAKAIRDGQGNPAGSRGTAYDITTRKQAEAAVKASEKMLQTIIDTEPACVKLLDRNANLISMNRAGLDMIQVDSLDQVKGQCVRPLIAAGYQQPFMELTSRVFQGGTGTLLFEIIGMKGRHLWLETHAVPLRNEKEEIFALLGVTRDVTERKAAEEKIRQSEEFVRSILDTVDEGFIVIDPDYRILTANKAYCSQVGGSDETVLGRHCYEVSHHLNQPCYKEGEECAVRQVFESGRSHSALHRHKDAAGNILYVETKAFPIKDEAGRVTSVIETINNITEKYLLEEERLKTQKLESIGTLAGGIAHDFNNLLQGVFGYISMAKMAIDQKEKSLAMLEQAEEALHLSVNLTTQLLTFSKGGKPVKKRISLNPVIENAAKFALSGSPIGYEMELAPDLWQVEADAGQLAQVIQNIVLNAKEAMAGSGTVHISAANVDGLATAPLSLSAERGFVRIDIRDTGTGIAGQNLAKIFDPYFTTKHRGSGLGLATSYSIIMNHGGEIRVKSELNKGSTFTLYLPAVAAGEPEEGPVTVATPEAKKGRILLMDDEDLVRKVAAEMIAALGHKVERAKDGSQAIEMFRQAGESGEPFDLLILDLTIKGGIGGEEAIREILEIDPKAKAVVSSGYADNPVAAHYRDFGFVAFLNKPYKLSELKECLDKALR
ncbi:MAG: hypothetical protein C0402_07965 [Thermodesulfovibrio sp.]|nr:hypothetical protein [Thermodesulfovibrio sp.]